VTENNSGPLAPEALKRIFERIIDEMRSLQKMRREADPSTTEGDQPC
jgi:chorismate mutase